MSPEKIKHLKRPQCTVIGFMPESGSPYIEVQRNGCIAVLGSDLDTLSIKPNTIKPASIDYKSFQKLINLCDETHLHCKAHSDANDVGLHVIDIWAKKIVRAPEGCRYIALSYVWGSNGEDACDDDLNSAPLVVQDAISVTASMDCQYLWIDRYVRVLARF